MQQGARQLISPQPGFQEMFLASPADVVIGGGAAGAGKSYALLMEPLRHVGNPKFNAVIFRRTIPQIKNPGGLWDTSTEFYSKLKDPNGKSPTPTQNPPKWKFPSGASLLFSHLEYEKDKLSWDGAQVCFLGFDELIHFTPGQFWYMLSRNRSSCGVHSYLRATTNPQTSGWVKRLIAWWIYPDDHENQNLRGMPIPERIGVIRYLARWNENCYWGDSRDSAISELPPDGREKYRPELVKSVTFIPGTLDDNTALTEKDPGYEGNLLAQDKKQGTRLRRGCWYDAEGENELFTYENIQDSYTNTFVPGGKMYMSCDIAMEGSDCFRVGIWDGLRLEAVYSWAKSDGKMILDEMRKLAEKYKVPGQNIVFDANGSGNFLTGFFKSSFDFRSQSTPLEDQGLKVDYANLRVQCLFKLSKLLAKIYLNIPHQTEREMISEELDAHKKTGQNPSGKLTATTKDEIKALIKRSPDYVDVLLMRMVFEISPVKKSALTQKLNNERYGQK